MSTATLAEALLEIERTQRNTQRLAEAGKLSEQVALRKLSALARAHRALMFLIANEHWILPIYKARERMQREAEALAADDPDVRAVLDGFDGTEITSVRALSGPLVAHRQPDPHTTLPEPAA